MQCMSMSSRWNISQDRSVMNTDKEGRSGSSSAATGWKSGWHGFPGWQTAGRGVCKRWEAICSFSQSDSSSSNSPKTTSSGQRYQRCRFTLALTSWAIRGWSCSCLCKSYQNDKSRRGAAVLSRELRKYLAYRRMMKFAICSSF